MSLFNVISFIFIDSAIATCFEKRYGYMLSNLIGGAFRLVEFGVVSATPPLISIITSNKYNIIAAATLTFFGMKFFAKIVEALSQDSIPSQLKQVRVSNTRLEESNARLEESNARLEESNARLEAQLNEMMSLIQYCRPTIYQPYDSPSNGD